MINLFTFFSAKEVMLIFCFMIKKHQITIQILVLRKKFKTFSDFIDIE